MATLRGQWLHMLILYLWRVEAILATLKTFITKMGWSGAKIKNMGWGKDVGPLQNMAELPPPSLELLKSVFSKNKHILKLKSGFRMFSATFGIMGEIP